MIRFLFLLFLFLSLITVRGQTLKETDHRVLYCINSNASAGKDHVFGFISDASTPLGCALPVSMFITGAIRHDETLKRNAYLGAVSLGISSGISYVLKISIRRERPFDQYTDIVKKSHGGSYSFPSGHTTFAFASAMSATLSFRKWYVAVPAFAWASSVAFSRMYLGVHFPTDVLAGALLGSATTWLTWKLGTAIFTKIRHAENQSVHDPSMLKFAF